MNIDITKNYTSSIKGFIENNNINALLSYILRYKDLSILLLPNANNTVVMQLLSNDNFSNKDKIFIIKELLKYKININCFNEFKQYPLHLVCLKNIHELIPLFMHQKNKKDIYGKYPFEYVFENFFLLKQTNNNKDFSITFDNLLYDSFDNIDYAISFSNIIKDYNILKNNSIEIFTSIQNVIDNKSIIVEKDFDAYLELQSDSKDFKDKFWQNFIENINQNKLYDKNNLKIPVKNIDLLNKMRDSILLGYLQYSIKMYNNLTNINFNDITSIINNYDKLLTHDKAVFPRNNIINFQDNYFIKGHNYLVIIPMPKHIGNLSYNSLITNYNYYNYKNWVVLKLFVRYKKNTQRIIDHFHQVFPQFKNILSNSSSLNWKELYWLLVSLPYTDKDKLYVSDTDNLGENFDTKYMQYLYKTIEKPKDDNDEHYKMFEYDYKKSMNDGPVEENSYYKLYQNKYCDIKKTILHNYLGTYDKKELEYLQISFGFEMILLFHCLLNNEYNKNLNEFNINSSYNDKFMAKYYTHKKDAHFTNVYSFKNHIDESRIKSSVMNMNQLLISYNKNPMKFIENEIFQKDEIVDKFLKDKDFIQKNYKWDDETYENIFVDFIMSKIKFLCTLKYQKVDISKLYYTELNDSAVMFENLFNNLEHIVKIVDSNLSVDEKINFIQETISPQNHLYSFIVKFIKVENKMNDQIKNYILILLLLLSNLWNLSNSFKQFHFPQFNFNNNILKKLYNKIQIFYNEKYKNKDIKLNFFTNKNLSTFTKFFKTKGIKEMIFSLSKNNDKYKLVYYLLTNIQQFINIFANIDNSFFLLNLLVSIYGNIIDCYLDKKQMFKFNVVDIAQKLEIDLSLIESLNKTEIITLSDILPVYFYILFNPNIIIDILKENENILFIVNNVYKLDLTLDDIKIIAGLITELKTLIFHSSNIYYLNGSFLNIMTYSCAASMKLCTLFFDDMQKDNLKNKKSLANKYFKLLAKYEAILHQHEFMLMFNSRNVDLHLFLNHISNINMKDCHVISVLMKVYGVHPKRQRIINEILDVKNNLIQSESGIDNQCINQIILQQVFYGVFFSECMDLNYINDTYSSYSYYYNQPHLSNIYGKNFHSQKFIIDKVLDTYSKHSSEKENKLHPFLDISNIYNTDKKIADIFRTEKKIFKNIGMNQTGQYIILIENTNPPPRTSAAKYKMYISHNYGQTFDDYEIPIQDPKNYNINIDNNGSKINFYKLESTTPPTTLKPTFKEIKNYGFGDLENIPQTEDIENENSELFIYQSYTKLFLCNIIKNYYKHIFINILAIMKKLNLNLITPAPKNPFNLNDTGNIKPTPPTPPPANLEKHQVLSPDDIDKYINMLSTDIENNTDTFLKLICNGEKKNYHGTDYYRFFVISYYDLLSFILNTNNKVNNNDILKFQIFSIHNIENKIYPSSSNHVIGDNHLAKILSFIKNEHVVGNQEIKNITEADRNPISNFYFYQNRFESHNFTKAINRYKYILFDDITDNKKITFKYDDSKTKYLYNKFNEDLSVYVVLEMKNNFMDINKEKNKILTDKIEMEIDKKNHIYTYLLKIITNNKEVIKEIVYLSYIGNEKINDINFSINGQQIIVSTTSTIAVSYDYGKQWDVDYLSNFLLHEKIKDDTDPNGLNLQIKDHDYKILKENTVNLIYSANINSHTNYQYIIAKMDGEHKILIRNGFNKQIVKEDDSIEIKKYKFFSDINNMKYYEYHEIDLPNYIKNKFKMGQWNEFKHIKIISNFYHNRMIFKFKDSVEFYYDHQFFYKEKIFYNARKMEDDIYIVLKENPDIKDYIIGSRIDMAIVCIFKKIEMLLVKIDSYTKDFYIELKKNYPDQQNNFIYLYSIYIEEVCFMMNEIDVLMKIIEKEKTSYEINVNNLLDYVLNNTTIKTNLAFQDFKGLVERTLELIEIKSDIVDKKLYEEYLEVLNKHLGVFNLYHYINKNDYYISRDLIKSSMIVKTFHSFKNTIEDFSTIDIIDENDVFLSYIKEKSIHDFLQNSKDINSKDFIRYYKKIDLKIDEYLKYTVKNSLYNTIVHNNRFFLKNGASILKDEKKSIINFEKYLNNENYTLNENKIFVLLPINNFIISDKWFIFQDLYYLDNHTLKLFLQKFQKHDKNIIKQIIPNIIDSCNNTLFQFITNTFNIIGYDYNVLIKQKINNLKNLRKEIVEHFKSSFQEKFQKEYNLEEIYLDDYYDEIVFVYENEIKKEINFIEPNFEILLDIPLKIFTENNISKDDEYNLKLYNLFNYKLNENNVDTIEFNNYITEQLNNSKLYFILLNYLDDIRNIINNFSMIDININRLQLMILNNREQNIKNVIN